MRTKIKDMKYERVDIEKLSKDLIAFAEQIKQAVSCEQILDIKNAVVKIMEDVETMFQLSYIRFSLNTKDEFYLQEKDYYDENMPLYQVAYQEYEKALFDSKFKEQLKGEINPILFMLIESNLKSFSEKIVTEVQEETKLVTQYAKFMSELTFDFRGEKMPLTLLKSHMLASDRQERKDAYEALGKELENSADTLDVIFDKLVKVRDKMAKKMGYENFVELGYARMNRIFYGKDDVLTFRKNVLKDIVPTVCKIKTQVAKNLGIDDFKLYDNDTYFIDTPKPILKAEEIFEQGKEMYHDMSEKTGEFIDMMLEADAFDVESRSGKWGGGYCTYLPNFKQPFILANFNGTSGDIDVLTHEAGHALNSWEGRDLDFDISYGMETAEVHSMSMEFLCWKYMDKFFGNKANEYRFSHLSDALAFIPYGSIVDEFQHIVYENPNLTPSERKTEYLNLEKKYRPYLNMEGMTYFDKGIRWQYQMHIYESPFYYIDYCIAQSIAIQFLAMSQEDYQKAFDAYFEFLKAGGTKPLQELIAKAGLKSPFEEGSLEEVSKKSIEILEKLS